MSQPPRIDLTPEEARIRKLLVDAAAAIEPTIPSLPADHPNASDKLTLRFTGGWVRDKLLGQQSNDIDVGINKMTGFEFATALQKFMEENAETYGIPAKSIHKIESNPDKSKHLETATTKILGVEVDFVNLRSETYEVDASHRIPEMKFGTPEQDAERRDACVNALFYNIHTQEVEDFTKRGLDDMRDRLIRTPLEPVQTFADDPLRVLRLIRFSSRLGFEIVPDTKKAMRRTDIKDALISKISRERVGVEIEKMLKGINPALALNLAHKLGLYMCIFAPPAPPFKKEHLPEIPTHEMSTATAALTYILSGAEPFITQYLLDGKDETESAENRYIAWNLAALTPWKDHIFPLDAKKSIPAAATAAREGLRLSNKWHDIVIKSFRNYSKIKSFVSNLNDVEVPKRGQIGIFIRGLDSIASCSSTATWKSQYLTAMLREMNEVWSTTEHQETVEPHDTKIQIISRLDAVAEPNAAALKIMERYKKALGVIYDMGLAECYSIPPVLNGNEVREAVVGKKGKGGPWLTEALRKVMEWQLDNPGGSADEAREWATANKEKLVNQKS